MRIDRSTALHSSAQALERTRTAQIQQVVGQCLSRYRSGVGKSFSTRINEENEPIGRRMNVAKTAGKTCSDDVQNTFSRDFYEELMQCVGGHVKGRSIAWTKIFQLHQNKTESLVRKRTHQKILRDMRR